MIALLGDSLSVGAFPYLKAKVPEAMRFADVGAFILPTMMNHVQTISDLGARSVYIMGGTNDLTSFDVPTVLSRLRTLGESLLSRGISVTVSTIPPQKTKNQGKVVALNTAILGGALGPNLRVADVGSAARPEELAPDGVHFAPASYQRMGEAWASIALSPLPYEPPAPPSPAPGSDDQESSPLMTAGLVALAAYAVYRLSRRG